MRSATRGAGKTKICMPWRDVQASLAPIFKLKAYRTILDSPLVGVVSMKVTRTEAVCQEL